MAGFAGGSAWAMARDISEGHVLVTERTFSRMKGSDLDKLHFELDRVMRGVRGNQPETGATQELQIRQRRLQRLTSAKRILQNYLVKTRRQAPTP